MGILLIVLILSLLFPIFCKVGIFIVNQDKKKEACSWVHWYVNFELCAGGLVLLTCVCLVFPWNIEVGRLLFVMLCLWVWLQS